MRVTVCQWPDAQNAIERAWEDLVAHARDQRSELVVLPEMPFSPWLAASREFNATRWQQAIEAHQRWEARLSEAGGASVVGTRPYTFGNERLSAAFIWDADTGCRAAHANSAVRNEERNWEEVWYGAAPRDFTPAHVGIAEVGLLIGWELHDLTEVTRYGEEGVHLLITPRATTASTAEEWLKAGAEAATRACAFGLSSNRVDARGHFGGAGWIIDPRGTLLARTTASEPFITRDLDLSEARRPRHHEPNRLPIMSSISAT